MRVTKEENPFVKRESDFYTNNETTKKLDFSRLSNPTVTLFRPSHEKATK